MSFRREVPEGEIVPWWLGLSYYLPAKRVSVCHPIPFNWLIRAARNAWMWLRVPAFEDRIDQRLEEVREDAYDEGHRIGRIAGLEEGRRQGWDARQEQLIEDYRRLREEDDT